MQKLCHKRILPDRTFPQFLPDLYSGGGDSYPNLTVGRFLPNYYRVNYYRKLTCSVYCKKRAIRNMMPILTELLPDNSYRTITAFFLQELCQRCGKIFVMAIGTIFAITRCEPQAIFTRSLPGGFLPETYDRYHRTYALNPYQKLTRPILTGLGGLQKTCHRQSLPETYRAGA